MRPMESAVGRDDSKALRKDLAEDLDEAIEDFRERERNLDMTSPL